MIHSTEIKCVHCDSNDLVKNGHSPKGTQRWRCNNCKKTFLLSYRYTAYKKGIKEQIIALTLNSSGVRDIGRVLGISKDTVCSTLKKKATNEPLFSYFGRKK
jgi:transposase